MYACASYQLIVHQGCVRPYICYGRAYGTIETEGAGVNFTDIFIYNSQTTNHVLPVTDYE